MHLFLSYCKSHIYDLHSLLVGTIIFFLVYVWKGQIDRVFEDWVNKHYSTKTDDAKKNAKKRLWGLIYLLVIPLSFLIYLAAASISPFVNNSVPASIISAAFAITEMEFYKTFFQKKG